VAYATGKAEPLYFTLNTYGTTAKGYSDQDLYFIVKNNFDFTPSSIIKELNLRNPIYKKTSRFGQFGRKDIAFTWEKPKTDLKLKSSPQRHNNSKAG
jgi:S-adenosylmethionine synthetase